jgi:hypothetical protein
MNELEPIDSIRAAATLAKSGRLRTGAAWVATVILLPSATAIAGWVAAKIDTRLEVNALSGKIDLLSGEVSVLTSQQQALTKVISGLNSDAEDSPGPVFVLRREVRYAIRATVGAQAMAIARETPPRRAQKKAAGELLMQAFDNYQRDNRFPPDTAAANVTAQVAVP